MSYQPFTPLFNKSKKDYQITIATDYKERVKEVLNEYGIFNISYIDNINSLGTEMPDAKILIITDRELFNKRQKDIPSGRKRHYKEKAEYIESINDIKEHEWFDGFDWDNVFEMTLCS